MKQIKEERLSEDETLHNMEMELLFTECKVDLSKKLELPPVALSYGEHELISKEGSQILPTPIGTYGNFSFIQAPPKTMKTYLISLLSGVYLSKEGRNKYSGDILAHRGNKCLIHFDTEQGHYHAQNVFKRVLSMNDSVDSKIYHTLALRQLGFDKRVEFIEYYINKVAEDNEIGIVVIDGIADLVSDVNNIEESNRCVQKVMEWTAKYKCHIITVIHTNFGSNKATGHLGSFLGKKAETSIELERNTTNKGWITVRCNMSRGVPFDTFSFQVNKQGFPEVVGLDFDILQGLGEKKKQYV